jgi:hypothetical protein
MLVKFNVNPSAAVTSTSARMVNFLNCVYAISTSAASGTPVVRPYTTAITSATDGTKNCITSVLSNTEAGGWTQSTVSSQVTNNNATLSNSTIYVMDLYTNTGKATYPYNKVAFGFPGVSQSSIDGSASNYGCIKHGMGTTATLSTIAWSTTYATNSANIWSDSSATTHPFYVGSSAAEDWEFLMAVTSSYMIISNRNGFFYYANREQNYYENSNVNGTFHCGFGYSARANPGKYSTNSGQGGTWVSTSIPYYNTNTATAGVRTEQVWNNQGSSYSYIDAISGMAPATANPASQAFLLYAGNPITYTNGQGATSTPSYYAPLFIKGSDYGVGAYMHEGLIQDATTQAWIPPAQSIIMKTYGQYSTYYYMTSPVKLPGILKGPNIAPAIWTAYSLTDYAEYTYNGETWVMVRSGTSSNTALTDIFFLRKA